MLSMRGRKSGSCVVLIVEEPFGLLLTRGGRSGSWVAGKKLVAKVGLMLNGRCSSSRSWVHGTLLINPKTGVDNVVIAPKHYALIGFTTSIYTLKGVDRDYSVPRRTDKRLSSLDNLECFLTLRWHWPIPSYHKFEAAV